MSLSTWSIGSTAPKFVRAGEADHEKQVSTHIGAMSVLWVDVPDEPGPESARAYVERNSIALLSNRLAPFERPSAAWLGRFSAREAIRQSGLWNLNYLQLEFDPAFLEVLRDSVERTKPQAAR